MVAVKAGVGRFWILSEGVYMVERSAASWRERAWGQQQQELSLSTLHLKYSTDIQVEILRKQLVILF